MAATTIPSRIERNTLNYLYHVFDVIDQAIHLRQPQAEYLHKGRHIVIPRREYNMRRQQIIRDVARLQAAELRKPKYDKLIVTPQEVAREKSRRGDNPEIVLPQHYAGRLTPELMGKMLRRQLG